MTADDALEFLTAGASAVAVGVAGFIHPGAVVQIAHDMWQYLVQNGHEDLHTVIGMAARQLR